jgi:1-aminocyclopropane-1-carboxylate deaminase/D-cysteine desulfhydrase-like pyridoxal-dependent ACC family enzyme
MVRTSTLDRLEAIPRIPLAEYPTALEPLPRLSAEVGRRIYVKRDDQLGPGMGGNKTRKLEYLLADAQRSGRGKLVTFGGLQSNHARLTVAAANRLGLETHLFYFDPRPTRLEGNLALNALLGAKMHFIPLGGGGGGMSLETTIRLVHWVAWARLGPHYFIPVGGHNALGCLGYVRAALEIDQQAREMGLEDACLVTAAGSGGTLAGLMAGLALGNSQLKLLGIDVGKLWKAFPTSIAALAGKICFQLGQAHQFAGRAVPFPSSLQSQGTEKPGGEAAVNYPTLEPPVPLIEAAYVGPSYGAPSPEGNAALRRLACLEGLLLDPVYTAKAFAGLLSELAAGHLGRNEPVIFLHTGGAPALFAFDEKTLQA